MINKFIDLYLKSTTYFVLILTFISCTKREELLFENQLFRLENYVDCTNTNCALVEIELIQTLDKTKVANAINTIIEQKACEFLNVEDSLTVVSIETAMQNFNDFYREMSKVFPEETPPYEALLTSEVTYQNTDIISILMSTYSFTGGAHGNSTTTLVNFDLSNGKLISIDKLLKDKKSFLHYAEEEFKKDYHIPLQNNINSTKFSFENDSFYLPQNIGFTKTDVLLYYNPYEISSYSDGLITIKLDKVKVAKFFKYNILDRFF
ncbi:DUF3298 and DUF4163 domain-containing protein [Aquimarina sp. W85]|uniref:DUF3298 and DUF4163 domain-containing protein n=1 Tax=Aquimarina rhodophyticola TaxID=3342246 RepID=UPI003673014F